MSHRAEEFTGQTQAPILNVICDDLRIGSNDRCEGWLPSGEDFRYSRDVRVKINFHVEDSHEV